MFNPYTHWASEMDGSVFSLPAFGLGSTLGLAVIVGIGLTSSDGGVPAGPGSLAHTALDYVSHLRNATHTSVKRARSTRTWRILVLICGYVYWCFVAVVFVVRAVARAFQYLKDRYRAVYGEFNWRNFTKLLRIFYIWEPLPYDLMVGKSSSDLSQPFEDRKQDGLVGVCLRFRLGYMRHRVVKRFDVGRTVHDRNFSIPAYLPLEKDGSLSVDLIREKFHIEEIELLIPGRWEVHRVTAGDVISPFLLHRLTEEFNSVNVVEVEDIFCQQRRRFRQWLRSTLLHYFVRLFCYFSPLGLIALAGTLGSMQASALFPDSMLWRYSCYLFGVFVSATGIVTVLEHRQRKYEWNRPWHTFPERYTAYWLPYRTRGKLLPEPTNTGSFKCK